MKIAITDIILSASEVKWRRPGRDWSRSDRSECERDSRALIPVISGESLPASVKSALAAEGDRTRHFRGENGWFCEDRRLAWSEGAGRR